MARIAGVNIPMNKQIAVSLTYIYGIGLTTARKICKRAGIDATERVIKLGEDQVGKLREIIDEDHQVEGELRRDTAMNIKRLMDLKTYRGLRHRRNLPVRGQRTSSNARTRKGPAKAIAGKKSN